MLSRYEARNEMYRSNPNSKIGENAVGKTMREIARACEFSSNLERFTNHAGRALGITMMLEAGGNDTIIARQQSHHAGPQIMAPYKRNTKIMESDVQDNLMGSYLSDRFKESRTTKKPPPKKLPLSNIQIRLRKGGYRIQIRLRKGSY
jgi:integrase